MYMYINIHTCIYVYIHIHMYLYIYRGGLGGVGRVDEGRHAHGNLVVLGHARHLQRFRTQSSQNVLESTDLPGQRKAFARLQYAAVLIELFFF